MVTPGDNSGRDADDGRSPGWKPSHADASPAGATASRLRHRWRTRPARLTAAVVLVLLCAAAAVSLPFLLRPAPEPVYVALVTSHTGSGAVRGQEISSGVRFHLDRINRTGGIRGHPVRLLPYDDRADPATARRTAERIGRDDRVALVIGNTSSPTASQAAPVYAAARIPFITPTATADGITANPWSFRTTYTNTYQGEFIAAYTHHVLGARSATVLHVNSAYGASLADGFRRAFTTKGRVHRVVALGDRSGNPRPDQLRHALEAARTDPDQGPVVLALPEDPALTTLTYLRRHGVRATVIGGDDLSNAQFSSRLAASHQERTAPGSMTGRFYAASPQLADSLTGAGLAWAAAFRDRYGAMPSWKAMSGQTAADVAVHALRRAKVHHADVTERDRAAVRDALAAMNTPDKGIPGVYGRVFFDRTRSLHLPVTMGTVQAGDIVSAPVQLTEYSPEEDVDVDRELNAGRAVSFQGKVLARQQIVYTGINVNRISTFDTREGTFKADFFLWFRYSGSDEATNVEFPNLADDKFKWTAPIRKSSANGVKYRLHQVVTTFSTPLDFHRFPFDRHHLAITLQNRTQPSSRVVYVVDRALVKQDRRELLHSGKDVRQTIDGLPNWTVRDLRLYKAAVGSTARLGDPDLAQGENGVHYAQYVADVTVARDVAPFLVKNLLPLLLSAAVTYATLFFPRDPRYTSTRVSLEVTAMLSAAVLLTNVTSSLPDVGYTVALEWAYYAFMFLVGTCVFISLAGAWIDEHDNVPAWNRLQVVSRVYYPVFCVAVLLVYLVHLG
ncbi:ABC transporter substrate-binding protein [Streptomyces ficellus]|uniref:ABC transporter substrate-binding protein n=1 Tax=Streptomyces ficellus TaxID=1977088 RepID=A0ABT7Z137_9ACTN|nr:ABC transporter substrate-binding protein [Streptomyces ficellus]MDN3292826.1 ABC transporter substrate-binding protein [Streptomyces ficellus]